MGSFISDHGTLDNEQDDAMYGEDGEDDEQSEAMSEEEDPERVEQLGEGEKERAKPQAAYTTPERKLTTGGLRYGAVRLPQPELE
ncbi:hypothetical protein B0H17DRAFT_1200346 [Mycena rosella]|uniref:Uncharacterized protein n=1 Tax=Mycena rosella TaxID=1033263 RepID=A0AAD7GIQ4_MYCRO|nr:hypothetical protein B0H17DRAFT_1200346 [Mycena rosella]